MKIILATGNKGKIKEVKEIFSDIADEILSMKDAGIEIEIDENGSTFAENAMIKAKAVAAMAPEALVFADDSGLEVDALNKEPGIYSARYGGKDTSYEIKNQMILDRLEGVEGHDRSARFVCAIACVLPRGVQVMKDGEMVGEFCVVENFEGEIAKKSAGENGFGYDPIFYVPEYGMTSAQLSAEEKNKISHRGKALRKLREILREL